MNEAVTIEHAPQTTTPMTAWKPPAAIEATPMAMLARAVENGASIEVIERMMGLSERWEANRARKAFDAAIAEAKAEIPPIIKNKIVDFTGKTGIRTNYRHETLSEIARTIDPILAKHGLSYRYRTLSPINEPITVTCIVSHRDGYSEENTLIGPRDDSGNKNSIQAIGSAVTYLQRYTLKAALGLSASEADDDGAKSGAPATITEEQIGALVELLDATGSNKGAFLGWLKIDKLADLPASRFEEAMAPLRKKAAK